ncbi:MAG: hypothetical protein HZB86_08165 [Deltaproteobacteria bacterium]|nr:hypothetical protein [Deltaproteobacteria bacterium]
MSSFRRNRALLAIAATLLFAAGAWAEAIFPVNESGTGAWVFDQPSAAPSGTTVHVAFIGDNTASGLFKVHYAAVSGAADFSSSTLTRSQALLTPAVAIDNGSLYSTARHPQIAMRSATQAVILFQGIPSDNAAAGYRLFRALVTLDNNVVTGQTVQEVAHPLSGRLAQTTVDPSFAVVPTDNTARIAFTDGATGDVYYARAGLDNGFLVGASPILLTKPADPRGLNPRPRLAIEGTARSHVVWAVDNVATEPSSIYYAMVKESLASTVDNLAIGATQVLSGPFHWGFPTIHAPAATRVLVFAAEEPAGTTGLAGPLGFAVLNPDAVTHDGNPVGPGNLPVNANFFLSPPGASVMPTVFDVYRPETVLDSQNFVHVAGYGFLSSSAPPSGTPGRLYTMSISGLTTGTGTAFGSAGMASSATPVGTGGLSFSTTLPGDYTRPAFAHFSGKAVLFWSGMDNVVPGARNLYVTTAIDSIDPPIPEKQAGCAMVAAGGPGENGRIPGAALLVLPAVLLAIRKYARKAFAR